MPYFAYVLRSATTHKLYKGHTDDLVRRLKEHNNKELGHRRYTRKDPGPWELVHSESFPTRSEAMIREKWYKTGQGRDWIKVHLNI